jgi:hypothetical protein
MIDIHRMTSLSRPSIARTGIMRKTRLGQMAFVIPKAMRTASDIARLTLSCRFSNCRHDTEPGWAVREAIERGELDKIRLQRRKKLIDEEAFNTQSLVQRRASDRAFGKLNKTEKKDLQE